MLERIPTVPDSPQMSPIRESALLQEQRNGIWYPPRAMERATGTEIIGESVGFPPELVAKLPAALPESNNAVEPLSSRLQRERRNP